MKVEDLFAIIRAPSGSPGKYTLPSGSQRED